MICLTLARGVFMFLRIIHNDRTRNRLIKGEKKLNEITVIVIKQMDFVLTSSLCIKLSEG
jgi:hypothetical protein